jgi:hypothetical protein
MHMDNLTCNNCNFSAKNLAGFKSHNRSCKVQNKQSHNHPVDSNCLDCSYLPVGSMQLTSVFMVITICLCAVLFAALFQLSDLRDEVSDLRQTISSYEN